MKKKVITIIAGVLIVSAIVFTQLPVLKAKAEVNKDYSYGITTTNFNYRSMYDFMRGLTSKDVQNMMGGRIDQRDAQNMLNTCRENLKDYFNQSEK